ncbi:hypothetical protein [Absidia glauca]|uniref:Uncharacterized protein n=1 Tax=Absidia glauca TaxID=4829 RepID=A0A168LEV3_ABSGL|nr:hypothetical protein [Absidia glauca]
MKLPSIHTLLNPAPPSPPSYEVNTHKQHMQQSSFSLPSVQVLPASPLSSTMDMATLSPMLSPALSSATMSPSISSIGSMSPLTMNSAEFPPIHGDDPPRRLLNSPPSFLQPRAPTHYLHHNHKRSASQGDKPLYVDHHHQQQQQQQQRQYPQPQHQQQPQQQAAPARRVSKPVASTSKGTPPAPPPCTEILISPSGQPILKRRRGRPPTRSPGYEEGGWTFLSPTVWDVASSSDPNNNNNVRKRGSTEEDRTDAMTTAFTSANMETVLPMPKKKRGRKPKTHIEGNSCFMWKDISVARRTSSSLTDHR